MKTVKYRDYQAALTALKNQFEEDGINIYDMVRTPEDSIRLGVNWAACGTVLPKDAAKFGDRLLDTASLEALAAVLLEALPEQAVRRAAVASRRLPVLILFII